MARPGKYNYEWPASVFWIVCSGRAAKRRLVGRHHRGLRPAGISDGLQAVVPDRATNDGGRSLTSRESRPEYSPECAVSYTNEGIQPSPGVERAESNFYPIV